jgi:tetratricopeptide (TPR) repeat protein
MVQQSKGIAVVGNISAQQGRVGDASIHTITDGYRLDVHRVDSRGNYKIELEYNRNYELIFALEGTFSQKIVVETVVPDNILETNPEFKSLTLDINLFPKIPGIKLSFVENPIRKIYFNPIINDFYSEIYKDDNQISKQIEQAVYQKQIINNETGFLSKLTRFELAEMKREYDKILLRANKVSEEVPVFTAFNENISSTGFFSNENAAPRINDDINKILNAIIVTAEIDKANAERYDDFVAEADNLLNQKKYTSARIFYHRALSIYPDDDYAKTQTGFIDVLLENRVADEQYSFMIAHADNSFSELLYNEAAKHYRNALQIKPGELYPKSRLEKINSFLNKELKDAERSTSYKQTLKEAEAMYHKQFYEKSLASYMNVLKLAPDDLLASRKVVEIKTEMTTLANQLMYDKLIASANKLFRKEQYSEAMKEYFAASELNPDNHYALIQINAINEKLIFEERFADFIAIADKQFEAGKYQESKENYLEALKMVSNDKYSQSRLKKIEDLLRVQTPNDDNTPSFALTNEMSDDDIPEYSETIFTEAIKPGAIDSGKSSEKTETLISGQVVTTAEKEMNLKVDNADTVLNTSRANQNQTGKTHHHDNMETAFLIPEPEASEVENEDQLNNIYNQYIQQANELYSAQKFVDSRKWYYKAWDIKPEQKGPLQRIDKINQLLKETPKTQLDKEYYYYVDLADSTFRSNQYAVARGWYNRALAVKSYEQYPKDQISEIEKKIAERMAAQSGKQFEMDIQKAAAALKEKNYNVARFWYKKALELQPENTEVKNKLLELEQTIN